MKRALLDVNVLLALLDAEHVDHAAATNWFREEIDGGWASCAITQNGFVRVISQPRYPSPVPPAEAIDKLAAACAGTHHLFLHQTVSVLDPGVARPDRILTSRQITDVYLLALATAHDARLITFDRSIPLGAVLGASPDNLVVLG